MKKLKMVIYFILLMHILSYCESRSVEIHDKSPHGFYTNDTLCRKADNVYTIRHL
jgi:hypothetical protein